MHTRLHAYAHSPIHRHNRTRTHTNTHMHETALVSYPMSKQTEMRGSGWVVDTTIVVPCPALECDAISNPSSAGMLAGLFVVLLLLCDGWRNLPKQETLTLDTTLCTSNRSIFLSSCCFVCLGVECRATAFRQLLLCRTKQKGKAASPRVQRFLTKHCDKHHHFDHR